MSDSRHVLPPGVSLRAPDGQKPLELTIRAADINELAWRIHDLIPLLQDGRLAELLKPASRDNDSSARHL